MITTFHCSYINSNGFWPNAALIGIAISHKLLYSNMALTVKMNVKYDINWMKVEQKPTFMLFDAILKGFLYTMYQMHYVYVCLLLIYTFKQYIIVYFLH